MQQVGVVALPGGRRAEGFEAFEGVIHRVQPRAPPLVRERRIGDDIVECLEGSALLELGVRQCIALRDQCRRIVVQDHVHPSEAASGGILLLSVECDRGGRLVTDLEQQRAGPTGGVVDGGGGAGPGIMDADDSRNDAADLGGSVELALALAALGGEVSHQVFVSVAQNVVAICTVLREIERLVFEYGDQVGQPIHHLLAGTQFGGVVEVRHVGQLVGVGQRGDYRLVDLVADVTLALQSNHVGKACARRDGDRRVGLICILVADVLDEKQNQDVVLVLAGVHAASQFVATRPERCVEFRFSKCHVAFLYVLVGPTPSHAAVVDVGDTCCAKTIRLRFRSARDAGKTTVDHVIKQGRRDCAPEACCQ